MSRISTRNWAKAILWLGAVMIASVFIASILTKGRQTSPKPITRGLIDSVWMELPRHDVRLRSPGVWEEAWLDTMYFMQVRDLATNRYRTVELYKQAYLKYKDPIHKHEFIQLEHDSAKVAENQAEWDADSIKYMEAVKRAQKARNK